MEKVEQYIKKHIKETSSPIIDWNGNIAIYQPWLTPKDARMVAQMAREEIYEWLQEHSQEYVYWMDEEFGKDDLINDLKKHLNNKKQVI